MQIPRWECWVDSLICVWCCWGVELDNVVVVIGALNSNAHEEDHVC